MSHKADFIAGKKDLLNGETRATIDHWVTKFPPEQKRSALIQGLLAAHHVHAVLALAVHPVSEPVFEEHVLGDLSSSKAADRVGEGVDVGASQIQPQAYFQVPPSQCGVPESRSGGQGGHEPPLIRVAPQAGLVHVGFGRHAPLLPSAFQQIERPE